ncbi:MAG: DUF3332 domain-containing protein [Muribaculaceae bacterium]|nr:DUF3332 domain-containing protein [Muribaculaceae bacterium]
MLFTSCIGSFQLTNKLLTWNQGIGSKFVNELVFFAFWVLPVYEVSALADILVLNSIEFWSGDNPVAQGTRLIDGNDGKYIVNCDATGYTVISCNDGSQVRLDFDSDEQQWSVTVGDDTYELFAFIDDTHVRMPEGSVVELSEAGVLAYSQAVVSSRAMALR